MTTEMDQDLKKEIRDAEMPILVNIISTLYNRTGFDFRDYALSSLKRRVKLQAHYEGALSLDQMLELQTTSADANSRLLIALTVHVTAMFRDPGFFQAVRNSIIPILRTYPYIRMWVAGCSTGQEVYSFAIVLYEEGLLSRSRIYATDVSDLVLGTARDGIYPLSAMQEYTKNYQNAGGQHDFSDYYTADNENAVLRPFLRENVIFAAHNLASDTSFNEFHWISCRNVMIYFNRALQNRVHGLFVDSLRTYGYLALGRSESMRFSESEHCFEPVSIRDRLYRKVI